MHAVHAWTAALAFAALAAATSAAAQSTYRITELFSDQDGSIQFIRLTETAGLDDQTAFKGLAITVTYRGGTRRWVFPNNLPNRQTAHRDVLVGIAPLRWFSAEVGYVPAFYAYTTCCTKVAYPDYALVQNFLPTDGATVDFAGVDRVTYAALPTDGANALFADQHVGPAEVQRATCESAPAQPCPAQFQLTPTLVAAVEYYDAAHDHYFVTASAPDIDALDSGRIPGWTRTGESFRVAVSSMTRLNIEYTYYADAVCRFYIPPEEGDSHFLSASADECAAVQARFPAFVLETPTAFYADTPLSSGECPVMDGFIDGDIALRPVFRLWNGRADTNHRYTTRPDLRDAMIARGWVSEGYGPLGVVWCVY